MTLFAQQGTEIISEFRRRAVRGLLDQQSLTQCGWPIGELSACLWRLWVWSFAISSFANGKVTSVADFAQQGTEISNSSVAWVA